MDGQERFCDLIEDSYKVNRHCDMIKGMHDMILIPRRVRTEKKKRILKENCRKKKVRADPEAMMIVPAMNDMSKEPKQPPRVGSIWISQSCKRMSSLW